jgi:hypothetical protein
VTVGKLACIAMMRKQSLMIQPLKAYLLIDHPSEPKQDFDSIGYLSYI